MMMIIRKYVQAYMKHVGTLLHTISSQSSYTHVPKIFDRIVYAYLRFDAKFLIRIAHEYLNNAYKPT